MQPSLALLLVVGLAFGCSTPVGSAPPPSPPTEIAGVLTGDDIAGIPIYAIGSSPYAESVVYEGVAGLDGSFRFTLTDSPNRNVSASCEVWAPSATAVFGVLASRSSLPNPGDQEPFTFFAAALTGTDGAGRDVAVVWLHTDGPETVGVDCGGAGGETVDVPGGWVTVLNQLEQPYGLSGPVPIPADAAWVTETWCVGEPCL